MPFSAHISPASLAMVAAAIAALFLAWALGLRRRLGAVESARETDQILAGQQQEHLQDRIRELHEALEVRERRLQDASDKLMAFQRDMAAAQAESRHKAAALQELAQAFEDSKAQMKQEFQNLASTVLEEKRVALSRNSETSLDALLRPFREQIDAFQRRVNQVHDETLRGNVSLSAEIRRIQEVGLKMSAEANTLARALKGDKKTTGNWGEVQLQRSLEAAGLVEGEHYRTQARLRDAHGNLRQPDFVILLPDDKHLVIDSKVSLVDYERAVAAEDPDALGEALGAHVRAVRQHIDDLAAKDYSNLIGMKSPSFVLMFLPVEPAYIEALKHTRDLFDYGYRRNVVMVSHTTLMPILKTVANLWMVARSTEQAQELSSRAGDIYNQVALVAERLKKLGDTLQTASRHYNGTITAVAGQQGLYGKVSRFGELSARANKPMPPLSPLHADFESERLQLILPDEEPASSS